MQEDVHGGHQESFLSALREPVRLPTDPSGRLEGVSPSRGIPSASVANLSADQTSLANVTPFAFDIPFQCGGARQQERQRRRSSQFYGLIRVEGERLHPVACRPPSFVSPCYLEASLKITLLSATLPSIVVNISLVTAARYKETGENRRRHLWEVL